eukprot:188928-Chlamydomonas_euryale.AAC.3
MPKVARQRVVDLKYTEVWTQRLLQSVVASTRLREAGGWSRCAPRSVHCAWFCRAAVMARVGAGTRAAVRFGASVGMVSVGMASVDAPVPHLHHAASRHEVQQHGACPQQRGRRRRNRPTRRAGRKRHLQGTHGFDVYELRHKTNSAHAHQASLALTTRQFYVY